MENNIKNFTSIKKVYNKSIHTGYEIIENEIMSFVPLDPANTDYQAIQEWITAGNTVIDNPPEGE